MKQRKSAKSDAQQHENGHLSPFKFTKLFDPDASWDKVSALFIYFLKNELVRM